MPIVYPVPPGTDKESFADQIMGLANPIGMAKVPWKGISIEALKKKSKEFVQSNRPFIEFYIAGRDGKPLLSNNPIAKKMHEIGQWQGDRLKSFLDKRFGKE